MKAYWLELTERGDVTTEDLEAVGVLASTMPTDEAEYQPKLTDLIAERGYKTQDVVELTPKTDNLAELCHKFRGEHHHDDDEVRFVLEGEGIFDIRSKDDEWMRVEVSAGDLLVVPKGLHHRFMLLPSRHIKCVRLFIDPAGWVAVYRN